MVVQRFGDTPMFRPAMFPSEMLRSLCLRLLSATGLLVLSFLVVGLAPFLSVLPTAGAMSAGQTSPISVNRNLKGDRLPIVGSTFKQSTSPSAAPAKPRQARAQIPEGCDPAFSPIFSLSQGNVYRRCTV
jgi:hypothetical protein